MNESGVRPEVGPPAETLAGPKKVAVMAALGAVFGFAAGYLLSWLTGLWVPTLLGSLTLCLGAAIGVGVSRWSDKNEAHS
jgi:hypothetical protein